MMKIKCPFCSFFINHEPAGHRAVLISADNLRYHLEYDCPINNIHYLGEYR